MHHCLVFHVAVGKDNDVHPLLADNLFHAAFFHNGNACGIKATRQLRRIVTSCNVGDLSGGKGDYVKFRLVAKDKVEIMEVSARSTNNENSSHSASKRH